MIYQPQNNVKWTNGHWGSPTTVPYYQKLTPKSQIKNFEEVDTDATASWSETIDHNLSDVEPTKTRKSFQVDCLDSEDVRSLLQRLGSLEELRQIKNQIKMVILESLSKENNALTPFLDRQCKQYSRKKVKQLFL